MKLTMTTKTLGLALALSIAALGAACGPPPPANTPEGASSATPAASGAPSVTPPPASAQPGAGQVTPPPATSGTPSATPGPGPGPGPAAGATSNTPVGPSKFLDDVKKAGIDLKKAPDLEKIGLSEKKKIMPFFVKSLGYEGCNGCHVEGDFKSVTRNMKITREMWRHFVVALRDDKGGAVFCDSCHQGKNKNLARADKKGVEKFMESDYVGKFSRADKKENACTSCHGDEMELKIIEKRWKIAAK